jgi:hypothetical protein
MDASFISEQMIFGGTFTRPGRFSTNGSQEARQLRMYNDGDF